MDQPVVRVGVGVIILNAAGQFLMGKRLNAHGEGAWSCPGGHLEFGEEIAQCARREAKEETDLDIADIEVIGVGNHIFPAYEKHYITVYCIARTTSDAPPILCEPEKCEAWVYFDDWRHLPQPLFIPYETDIDAGWIDAYRAKHGLGRGRA